MPPERSMANPPDGAAAHGSSVQSGGLLQLPEEHKKLTVALTYPDVQLAVHVLPEGSGYEREEHGAEPEDMLSAGTVGGAARQGLAEQLAPPIHAPARHV